MKTIDKGDCWVIEGDIQCSACFGTGVYVGMAERDGAAVICSRCDGSGHMKWTSTLYKFTGRKIKSGVERVYANGGGYMISSKDVTREDGTIIKFSQAGVSYDKWIEGQKPEPIRDLLCPFQHTDHALQSKDVNDLYKTRCRDSLECGRLISDCKHQKDKAKCWEIYEKSR